MNARKMAKELGWDERNIRRECLSCASLGHGCPGADVITYPYRKAGATDGDCDMNCYEEEDAISKAKGGRP